MPFGLILAENGVTPVGERSEPLSALRKSLSEAL